MTSLNDIVLVDVLKVLNDIEDKIDEYTNAIEGAKETAFIDTLYIEYISFLDKTRSKLESVIHLIKEV